MTEKFLGFEEKDAFKESMGYVIQYKRYCIKEEDLVPVRLASESVGLKELKEKCREMEKKLPVCEKRCFAEDGYSTALDEIISWAEKEAKKN